MRRSSCDKIIVLIVCLSVLGLGVPQSASARIVGTTEYLALQDRDVRIERINAALMQDNVREQLVAMGVNPSDAKDRVAALTDKELASLDQRIQDLPAGGGALELVLVVFLILLILDLTGLTDIFPGIGPGKVR